MVAVLSLTVPPQDPVLQAGAQGPEPRWQLPAPIPHPHWMAVGASVLQHGSAPRAVPQCVTTKLGVSLCRAVILCHASGSAWIFCQPQNRIKTRGRLVLLTGRIRSLIASVCTDFFLPVEAKLGNGLQLIFVALIKDPWHHFLAGLWGDGCMAQGINAVVLLVRYSHKSGNQHWKGLFFFFFPSLCF